MADRFTDSQMLKLVETYRDYPCLWNRTSDLYKNRFARESAYKEIWEKLNIPGLSIKDIPKKIKNMRSSYYQELKKIEKSTRSDASQDSLYKPKVSWFATADGFLKMFWNKQETFWNIDENLNTPSDNESETLKMEVNYYEENSDSADERDNTEDNYNEMNRIESHQNEDSSSGCTVPSKKPLKKMKRKNNEDIINIAIDRIDKIAKNITKTTNSLADNKNKEDEFDIFGKYIAMTLRSLPAELAVIGKTDIQKAISDVQIKALRQNTEHAPILSGALTSQDPLNPGYFSSASESSVSNYDKGLRRVFKEE